MKVTMPMEKEAVFFTLQGDDQVASLNMEKWDAGPKMTYLSTNNHGSLILATSSGSDAVFAFDASQGSQISEIQVGSTPKEVNSIQMTKWPL